MTGLATGSESQEPASSSKKGVRYSMLAKSSNHKTDSGDLTKVFGQAMKGGAGLTLSQKFLVGARCEPEELFKPTGEEGKP